jgi:hypothetical protein
MPSERSWFFDWEGRAAISFRVEGWAFIRGSWTRADPLEISDSGRMVSPEAFDRWFPDLPALPDEAFSSSPMAARQ